MKSWTMQDNRQQQQYMDALCILTSEAVFHIGNGLLSVRALGTSNVNALFLSLPITGTLETFSFALKVEDLCKVLKAVKDPTYELTDVLTIRGSGRSYTLTVYATEHIREAPKQVPPGAMQFTVTAKEYQQAISDVTLFATEITHVATTEGFALLGRDNALQNSARITVDADAQKIVPCTQLYDAKHLDALQPLLKSPDPIMVSFASGYPLVVSDTENTFSFVLAPRVGN